MNHASKHPSSVGKFLTTLGNLAGAFISTISGGKLCIIIHSHCSSHSSINIGAKTLHLRSNAAAATRRDESRTIKPSIISSAACCSSHVRLRIRLLSFRLTHHYHHRQCGATKKKTTGIPASLDGTILTLHQSSQMKKMLSNEGRVVVACFSGYCFSSRVLFFPCPS